MTDCVFCKIVERKIPASVVYEDGETIAFMDIGAVNPGHTLVVAKPHVENVFGLDDALAARLAQTTARVARAVQWAFQPPGMSVYQANGAPAGEEPAAGRTRRERGEDQGGAGGGLKEPGTAKAQRAQRHARGCVCSKRSACRRPGRGGAAAREPHVARC